MINFDKRRERDYIWIKINKYYLGGKMTMGLEGESEDPKKVETIDMRPVDSKSLEADNRRVQEDVEIMRIKNERKKELDLILPIYIKQIDEVANEIEKEDIKGGKEYAKILFEEAQQKANRYNGATIFWQMSAFEVAYNMSEFYREVALDLHRLLDIHSRKKEFGQRR